MIDDFRKKRLVRGRQLRGAFLDPFFQLVVRVAENRVGQFPHGDILAGADHPQSLAGRAENHLAPPLDDPLGPIRANDPMLQAEGLEVPARSFDGPPDRHSIAGMNVFEELLKTQRHLLGL